MNPRTKAEQLANHGWKKLLSFSIISGWHIDIVLEDTKVKNYTEEDKVKASGLIEKRLRRWKELGQKLTHGPDEEVFKEFQECVQKPIRE